MQGRPRRRREHRLASAPTPPTGRSATRTAAARSSVTRPSRATARAAAARSAPTTGAPTASPAPPTTRWALDGDRRHRRRPPRELRRRRSATTARRTATPTRPPGGRVGPDMPENQLFGVMYVGDNDSHRFPLTVPADERERRVRRRPDLAQHRHLAEHLDEHRHRTSSAGSGTRSRRRPQYPRASPAGVKRLTEHERPDRRRQQLAPGRGPAARDHAAAAASPARSTRSSTRAPSGALGLRAGHDAVVVRALRRRRPADPAGHLQHPLGHGRPAGLTRTDHRSTRRARTSRRSPPSRSRRTRLTRTRRSPSTPRRPPTPTARSRIRVGPRRRRHLRDQHRHDRRRSPTSYATEGTFDVRLRVTDNGGATDVTSRR